MESRRFGAFVAGILLAFSLTLPTRLFAQGACCQNAGSDGASCLGEFDEFCDEFSECGGCGGVWIPGIACSSGDCANVPRGACCIGNSFCTDEVLDVECSGPFDIFYGNTSTCFSQGEFCGVLPIELTRFDGVVDGNRVELTWETASESNNAGFEIERRVDDELFTVIGFVAGHGTANTPNRYSFSVEGLSPGIQAFRLKQTDLDGGFSYSATVELVVEIPGQYFVEAAYPNPFNPSTSIRYSVSVDQLVTVTLHDASGSQVRVLESGLLKANEVQKVSIDGGNLASGSYFVRFTGRDFVTSQQIVLVK